MDITNDSFNILAEEVRSCTGCALSQSRVQALPSESQPGARILLIGESPGATEDREGRNFCGPSGRFLNFCLEQAGMSRRDINVSPVLHCHPPGNRNPLPDEAAACLPFLHRHFALMDPAIVVIVGGVAARWVLGESAVGAIAGTWREYRGRPVLVTYHPAAGMRFPAKREAMLRHFRALGDRSRGLGLLR